MDPGPRKLLIDTDPGIDDAMAIFYALESPELEVVGLTTVFGNADTEVTTRNALSLLEIAQRSDIPVAAGAVKPLAMDYRGPAAFVHGPDGQGGVNPPAPTTAPLPADAAHFIIDTVMSAPGQITLVPLGPLTNVALAMLLEPRLTRQVAEIVLMQGAAFVGGNVSPAGAAKILNDPEAADIVFGATGVAPGGLPFDREPVDQARDLEHAAHRLRWMSQDQIIPALPRRLLCPQQLLETCRVDERHPAEVDNRSSCNRADGLDELAGRVHVDLAADRDQLPRVS